MVRRRHDTEYHKASDLINSQPGFKDIRKDPEEMVKKFISDWLESNGCVVYWEKINKFCKPTFKTVNDGMGTVEKPDLIIKRNRFDGSPVYYAIEVKDATSDSSVYDSFPQILRYAEGKLNFSINEMPITVSGYFASNQFSIKGNLFSNDVLGDINKYSDGRKEAIIKGELPEKEYILTEEYIRLLWRMAKSRGFEARVGALLSTSLNGASVPAPMVQYADIKGDAGFQGIETWRR